LLEHISNALNKYLLWHYGGYPLIAGWLKKVLLFIRRKKEMKKVLALILATMMVFALVSCKDPAPTPDPAPAPAPAPAPEPAPAPAPEPAPAPVPELPPEIALKVGISMPTQSLQRWNEDGNNLKAEFEALGYEVDLQFGGDNEVAVQIAQIENMVSGGCNVLVISAIDGSSLTNVLNDAKSKGVVTVAYDRLILGTNAVDYYATFGNWQVGVEQGLAVEKALDLKSGAGPFNIEFFTGDPGDHNITFFYPGAMSILDPYLDNGQLVCLSGQTDIDVVATEGWSSEKAQARMENLIATNNYGPGKTPLHAVMCSNDSTAQGVTVALLGAGFVGGPDFPVITGQDCDKVSVKNMIAGTQYMSVFKDTRILANRVKTMVIQILSGANVETNAAHNNEARDVPTYECELLLGTKDNYREILIDSGYYTEADLA